MKRVLFAVVAAGFVGCASEAPVTPGVTPPGGDEDVGVVVDTAIVDAADATPFPVKRLPCVGRTQLARDLPSEQLGALEGELVSIVLPTDKGCPADPDHLHLQIAVGTKRYDVAVTVDSDFGAPVAIFSQKRPVSVIPPDGWAAVTFDYNKDIGTPSADYQALSRDAMLTRLQMELAKAARVRVYGRSYMDGTGVHNVHRNGRDRDGVILIHHVDGGDRAIALRFANDVF